MLDQPLQPFSFPSINFFSYLPGDLSAGLFTTWLLYAVFAFWAIYTLIAIYHWLKYSHASWIAFPAIAMHLFVSFALMSYTLSSNAPFATPYLS